MGSSQQSDSWTSKLNNLVRRNTGLNFYRCHLAYFIVSILVSSAVLWGANTGGYQTRYIDSLFLTASAMTTTGLNTVDYNVLTAYQQSILFVLMILGDLSTVSISTVVIRRYFFRESMGKRIAKSPGARKIVAEIDEEKGEQQNGGVRRRAGPKPKQELEDRSRSPTYPTRTRHHGFGGIAAPWEWPIWKNYVSRHWRRLPKDGPQSADHHYLSFEPRLDSRGRFRQLSHEEYSELGGVEYRALKVLCWVLPTHTAFWIFLPMIILAPYATSYGPVASTIRDSQPGNLSPGWWSVFVSLSSYTNCGFTLLNDSMIPFQSNWLILIVTSAGIIAGNTFYPIFLRIYIWLLWLVVPKNTELHHSLSFILHHPRRCYLWLFDKKTTWKLTFIQFGLILGEWVLFELLNINQTAINTLPLGMRIMDGLYQCLGTRSAGYYILTISSIAPAVQIIYIVIMYISVFPILISLRTTNIYEERSIGLDAEQYEAQQKSRHGNDGKSSTGTHIRNQLAYDLWWIVLAWILICIIEEPQLNASAPGFNNFTILFEVVSAYGNCGLSLGVPYAFYSLSGQFHDLSKLVLIPVMLRGRHRILPLAIDHSIMIPGQRLMEKMDQHYNSTLSEHSMEHRIREAERGEKAERPKGSKAVQDPENDGSSEAHMAPEDRD